MSGAGCVLVPVPVRFHVVDMEAVAARMAVGAAHLGKANRLGRDDLVHAISSADPQYQQVGLKIKLSIIIIRGIGILVCWVKVEAIYETYRIGLHVI